MKDHALRCQTRQEGSGVLRVAVEGQVVGPQRVDHDQDDVDVPGFATRLSRLAGREEYRQEAQNRGLECRSERAPHADSLRDCADSIKVPQRSCAPQWGCALSRGCEDLEMWRVLTGIVAGVWALGCRYKR